MVIPAENVPMEDRHCSQNGVRNILGLVDGNHVALGFCEEHYHIVKQFVEGEQDGNRKTTTVQMKSGALSLDFTTESASLPITTTEKS